MNDLVDFYVQWHLDRRQLPEYAPNETARRELEVGWVIAGMLWTAVLVVGMMA